jgi:hypothetical protein
MFCVIVLPMFFHAIVIETWNWSEAIWNYCIRRSWVLAFFPFILLWSQSRTNITHVHNLSYGSLTQHHNVPFPIPKAKKNEERIRRPQHNWQSLESRNDHCSSLMNVAEYKHHVVFVLIRTTIQAVLSFDMKTSLQYHFYARLIQNPSIHGSTSVRPVRSSETPSA